QGPAASLASECPHAPRAIVAVIDRAMAPSAEARFPGAASMAAALESVLSPRDSSRGRRRLLTGVGIFSLALVVFLASRAAVNQTPPTAEFSVFPPANMVLDEDPANSAVSPDGRLLAFVARDSTRTSRLWVRPLNSLSARALDGTEGAEGPFWSPDSRSLG